MRAGSGLVPQAMAHVMRVGGNAAHQADDVADHQFHHGTGVGIRGVEHADAMLARIIEIHLIGADAEASDRGQGRASVDDRCGHGRLGPYAEQLTPSSASMSSFSPRAPCASLLRNRDRAAIAPHPGECFPIRELLPWYLPYSCKAVSSSPVRTITNRCVGLVIAT